MDSVSFLDKIARWISDVLSPPSIFAMLGFSLGWARSSFWIGVMWGALYGFFVSLAPVLVVVYLLKTGRVSDIHIRDRRQRHIPYLAAVTGAAMVCLLAFLLEAPPVIQALTAGTLIGLSILALVNIFWLISNHMASISMAVVFLGVILQPVVGLALSPLVGLVFFARWRLRRHTLAQLFAGMATGVATVGSVVAIGLL